MILTILAAAFFCQGCGKAGDPVPPDVVIPQKISYIAAEREKGAILLRWDISGLTSEIARVRILRFAGAAAETCPGCYREYETIADLRFKEIKTDDRQKGVFAYRDAMVKEGFFYAYIVIACDASGYCSERSDAAEINYDARTEK